MNSGGGRGKDCGEMSYLVVVVVVACLGSLRIRMSAGDQLNLELRLDPKCKACQRSKVIETSPS